MISYGVTGDGGEEVSSQHASKNEGDDPRKEDRATDGGEAGHEIGTCFIDLVDGVDPSAAIHGIANESVRALLR